MSTYCSTKYAINGFVETLHMEEAVDKGLDLKVTTVYPFTINTGFAKRPISRFPLLFPFTNPEDCAHIIIEGVQRDKRTVFIPKHLEPLFGIQALVPYDVKVMTMDFLGVGVLPHDD